MINKALRLIRQYHDLKQFELANKLGLSTSYLSEIESGKKPASLDLLERYSEEFDIPLSSLIFFSESLNNKQRASEKLRAVFSKKMLEIMEWLVNKNNEERTKAAN